MASTRPLQRLMDVLVSTDLRRRIRLLQWLVGSVVYIGAGLLMYSGIADGWMHASDLAAWSVFVAVSHLAAYFALRSGWSERLADPALTQWQIATGVIAVDWGYLICGPMRTVALFPLLLIFAFGAFSLHWRRILALTAFAVLTLALTVAAREAGMVQRQWPQFESLPIDRGNFLMVLVLLPALSFIAARLSVLRSTLHRQKRALAQALAEVQRLATCDELTGLPNRRSMMERLAQAQADMRDGGAGFCVAVIDLDDFKQVNDRLGHAQGDELLRAFAREASGLLRGSDQLGRWGGEEFLLLLHGVEPGDARRVVERLQQQAATVDAATGPLRFSAGLARYRPGENVLDTVARADQAMYAAKRAGRNAVRIDPSATLVSEALASISDSER